MTYIKWPIEVTILSIMGKLYSLEDKSMALKKIIKARRKQCKNL